VFVALILQQLIKYCLRPIVGMMTSIDWSINTAKQDFTGIDSKLSAVFRLLKKTIDRNGNIEIVFKDQQIQ
jgi:hypothetical protein